MHLQLDATDQALQSYQKSLELSEARAKTAPDDSEAKWDLAVFSNRLAWLKSTCWDDSVRDGKLAVELASKACGLTEWKDLYFLETLAAAYAEAAQFDDAVKWEKKALEQPDVLEPAGLEQAKAQLKLFEAHKPYHEPRPEPAPGPKDRAPSR